MKKTILFILVTLFSTNVFADNGCRVYFDELAMLKTVKNFEVDHHRFEQIQLLENNLYRKGYIFSSHEASSNFKLEMYDVNDIGKCAEARVMLTDTYKGKSKSVEGSACSALSFIANTSAISAAKEAIRKLPDCRKF